MVGRTRTVFGGRSFQRSLLSLTRSAMRVGSKVMKRALRAAPRRPKRPAANTTVAKRVPVQRVAAKRPPAPAPGLRTGMVTGVSGMRRYQLYTPPGVRRTERLPLLVMLHGCAQDAQALAASSHMNRLAARDRFLVLYPEQGRQSNPHACWNWFDTRSGRAQREADSIAAAIDQVALSHPMDPKRIALAGLSSGASMAALLATRQPERFSAVAMHSGIAPGVAQSSAGALMAMRGRKARAGPLVGSAQLPALLVIHGSADAVVASSNGAEAAQRWATHEGAKARPARTVQRGARYAATVTDYRTQGRLVATLYEIKGLGHAWSGGAAAQPYSDPKGPDASRLVWSFAARQFAIRARIQLV